MPLSYTAGDWKTGDSMVRVSDMEVNGGVDEHCVVESTVVVKDMFGVPLSLTRFSRTEDSSDYNHREEVLAREL